MKTYSRLVESLPNKTVVFAFGRCNPFTTGHAILANKLAQLSKSYKADNMFVLSKSQDSKKNPLDLDKKLYWAKKLVPNVNFVGASSTMPSFIHVAKHLGSTYKHLIMVAGSDRVQEFETLLNKYNGKDYHFESIKVISAGERDPDADDASGMSGTKLREIAASGKEEDFKKGIPGNLSKVDAKRYMNDIRLGMGLEALTEHIKIETSTLREDYHKGQLFNVGDHVKDSNTLYEVLHLGSNYVTIINENKEVKRSWFDGLTKTDDSLYNSYFTSDFITETASETFKISLKAFENGEFEDKFALVSAFINIDKYYQNGDDSLLSKAKLNLENINQLDNHEYLKELIEMKLKSSIQEQTYNDYEIVDGVQHDYSMDHDTKSLENATDDELEHIIKQHLHDDDYLSEYDEDDLCVVDAETGEEVELEEPEGVNESMLNEVLSRIERMRSSIRFHRTETKRNRRLEIALRKRSDSKTLNKRARRLAVKAIERRLAKKPLHSLSISEKERIEKRIGRLKPVISRMAIRLLPKVKKLENDRLNHKKTQ